MSLPTEPDELLFLNEENSNQDKDKNSSASSKDTSSKRRFGTILGPLRVRNYRLLFGGQAISTIGDAFYAVALPWLVLTNGGNAQELGIVLTAYGLPRIGTVLLGGVLSDMLRPRRVMLLADSVRAVFVGALALLALRGHPSLWQLLVIAVPLGTFEGLFLPASFAMLPEVLQDEDLQAGNALNFSSIQLANLVGSGLAGIVVAAFQSGIALALDALSFVVSAISLVAMRSSRQTMPAKADESVEGQRARQASPPSIHTSPAPIEEINRTPKEGGREEVDTAEPSITFWQLVRSSQLVQVAFVVSVIANLTFGGTLEVALPALAKGPLAAGASGFGLMLAAFGAGAFAGGVVTGSLGNLHHRGMIALLMGLLQSFTVAIIPFSGGLLGATLSMAAMGVCNSVTNIIFMTIIQQVLPRHLLGRIMGLFMFASFGSYPLSVAVAGFVVARFGPVIIFVVTGAALFVAIVFGLLHRELREL